MRNASNHLGQDETLNRVAGKLFEHDFKD